MIREQLLLDIHHKLIVDLFAGGGGMSLGIEQALGRPVDIAINHDADALSMHQVNHPQTRHFLSDVYEVDPRVATGGRPVGLLHLSPDCTDHSQAKAGQPRNKKIRALAWVGIRWVGQVRPDIATLENVNQIEKWTRLVAKRDPATGRVVRVDGTVAAKGERVPVQEQFLVPDPKSIGRTWRRYLAILRGMGYVVETRSWVSADYGAGTTRERLYMVARCDGLPIVWEEATHTEGAEHGKPKWSSTASHLDFTIPTVSIFLGKDDAKRLNVRRPLADNTLRRVARGTKRFVIDKDNPFIIPASGADVLAAANADCADLVSMPLIAKFRGKSEGRDIRDPVPTITSGAGAARPAGCAHALGMVNPILIKAGAVPDASQSNAQPDTVAALGMIQTGYGERPGQAPRSLDLSRPLGVVVAGGCKNAVTSTIMTRADGRQYGSGEAISAANIVTLRKGCIGSDIESALSTTTASADHHGLVTTTMVNVVTESDCEQFTTDPVGSRALKAASLISYYGPKGEGKGVLRGGTVDAPIATQTTENRHGLVTTSLVAPYVTAMSENAVGLDVRDPMQTILAGAARYGVVNCTLSREHHSAALRVARFILEYTGVALDVIDAKTEAELLAEITVWVEGVPYVIVDIQLRMLTPRELFNCQGFPASYIIDRGHDGRRFSKSAQVRMCGNSVSPPPAKALIRGNARHLMAWGGRERHAQLVAA